MKQWAAVPEFEIKVEAVVGGATATAAVYPPGQPVVRLRARGKSPAAAMAALVEKAAAAGLSGVKWCAPTVHSTLKGTVPPRRARPRRTGLGD